MIYVDLQISYRSQMSLFIKKKNEQNYYFISHIFLCTEKKFWCEEGNKKKKNGNFLSTHDGYGQKETCDPKVWENR